MVLYFWKYWKLFRSIYASSDSISSIVLQRADVLRDDWVPISRDDIKHRNQELNNLARALRPIKDGDPGDSTFLFGDTGVGKTCISRYIVEELERELLEINTKYINCWDDYNRFRVLYRILEGIGETLDIHRQSTPTDELVDRVCQYSGKPYVVILDEVDQLEDQSILYDLHRVRDITVILIANREEDLFNQLDDRVASRLRGNRQTYLNPYGIDELADILQSRARYALRKDSIGRKELLDISDRVAGDARVGLNILKTAAREAEEEGFEEISVDVIERIAPQARSEVKQKNLDKLNPHQKALLEILKEEGELGGKIYELYRERVKNPKTDRTVRNYLQKMQHYNLIVAEGEKRARTYRIDNSQ